MIPQYPNFIPLKLSHRDEVHGITQHFLPYSDFNFTSMFSWNTDDSTAISLLNKNLVVRMPDYLDSSRHIHSVLGKNKIDNTLNYLLDDIDELRLVPEPVLECADLNRFTCQPDRDNFDYVYDVSHLTELAGGKYRKKRNKVNVFVKDHSDLELQVHARRQLNQADQQAIRALQLEWSKHSQQSQQELVNERHALERLLANADSFSLLTTLVVVDDRLVAFSIGESLQAGYAICHFEKAIAAHHTNLNTFVVTQMARSLQEVGCKYVNWEQDLGLEGLRQSKLSYHPSTMLKKFTVSRAKI